MSNPVLIVDGDPIVYRSAFAAQSTTYEYVYETAAGKVQQRFFTDGNKARKFFKRFPKLIVHDKTPHVEAERPGFARQAARTLLQHTIESAKKRWGVDQDGMDVEVYLSGPGNFREKIATISEYKGGRTQEPPIHYQTVRNYLTDTWNASVVHDWEADDQVAIRTRQLQADGTPCILATIDKDLDQVPGVHYDYRQHVFYEVDPDDADFFFWVQVLAGDSTDSIQGVHKLGVTGAKKILEDWFEEWEEAYAVELDERWLWDRVVVVYERAIEMYPDKYPEGMSGEEAALETARLVKMMEYEGQLWTPPNEDDLDVGTFLREIG